MDRIEGGKKAAETSKKRYGSKFHQTIGRKGGKTSRGGGFAYLARTNPEKLKEISRKGGKVSKLFDVKA